MGKRMFLMMLLMGGVIFSAFAQSGKLSPGTRMIIAERDGKISFEAEKSVRQLKKKQKRLAPVQSPTDYFKSQDNTEFPYALPSVVDGVKRVQCWISMTDGDYAGLEKLGVKIQAKFSGKVTASVPVKVIEAVAAQKNVTKISVAKNLRKTTYRSRVLTNVDDVLTYSSDAQTAGLLQAYDGSGVVLGIIDTGIDFGHQMFAGRIKKKYIYNTTDEELQEYTGSTVYYTDETHGTHTSSIAGGSDYTATAYVYTTSSTYSTVNNATFGGMAPGTDLVLCDLGEELTDANISACIKNIHDYAESVGKPYVISLSLGGHFGPHDGTGDMADVCAQYTGEGKIIVFATGNEGEDGIYLGKNASASSPALTVLTSGTRSSYSVDYGAMISYARTANVALAARYYVVNTNTNTVLWTSNEITTDSYFEDENGNIELYGAEISVNDTGSDGTTKLSNYFTAYNSDNDNYGYLCCYMDQDAHNNKWYVETILYYLKAVSNNYKIGVSIYPKAGTSYVDSWPVSYIDFTASSATVNGNQFVAGTDESSASDESSFPSVISVGAYCSSKYWRAGTTSASNQYWTSNGVYGQISMFSSYQPAGSGPTGIRQPWITAPGEVILAAYNSGYSAESNYYYAYGTNKVLGAMSGTSMATPCVAGITALWLQAKPTMTPDEVKEVMAETAIKDSYVTGTYASHFGNGKIDALAGIQYILSDNPLIRATPATVTFSEKSAGTYTQTVTVKGANLTGNITATLADANGIYSIDKTTITQAAAESTDGVTLTITYSPAGEGSTSATVTLSSAGATDVTINITGSVVSGGTASDAYLDIQKYETIDEAGWRTALVNNLYDYTEYKTDKVAWLTLPVYGGVVGAKYSTTSSTFNSGNPQKWIETSVSQSNQCGNTTWSANDVHLGSSNYFTSATAMAVGTNSQNSRTDKTVTFYVTNTTAVKLYCSQRSTSTTYPTTLSVYECTENSDGTLTAATTATKSTSRTTSGAGNLSITDLDASKIYKVVASQARGYLYEIGFQTPLKSAEIIASPTSLSFETTVGVPVTKTFNVKGNELEGDITATLTDANGVYSLDASSITVNEAQSGTGKDVTVTFSPSVAGNYTGTITLTSTEATNVTVSLNGKATKPEIIADPEELSFKCEVDETVTKTFDILAADLIDVVSATLTDENGVFSVDPSSIGIAAAEEGATITVTFAPTAVGNYTGTVTLSSEKADDVTVTLNGEATRKTPDYYDAVVGQYGVSTLYLDFPVAIPYDDYDPDLLGVYYAYGITDDGTDIKLARLEDYIPANTGVVIQANSGTYRFLKTKDTVTPLTRSNLLQGAVEDLLVSDVLSQKAGSIVMTLGLGSNGYIGFYQYKGTKLNAYKAFLIYENANNNAKGLALSIGDENGEATGIRAIGIDTGTHDGQWFTPQGMLLNKQPTTRGIYIHNGKKIVIKD